MSADEEDYGDFDENDLSLPLGPSSQNPSDFEDDRPAKRRKTWGGEQDDSEEERARKKKSKYKIHIPKDNAVPPMQIQYGTQVGGHPDSSPERIRGAIWKLPKKTPPPPPALGAPLNRSTTNIMKAMMERSNPKMTQSKLPQNHQAMTSSKPTSSVQADKSALKPTSLHEPIAIDDDEDEDEDRNTIQQSLPQRHSETGLGPSQIDMTHELADLPSDAFSSSPEREAALPSRSIGGFSQSSQRPANTQNGMRQATLFGGQASFEAGPSTQTNKVHNYVMDMVPEPPTHHKLDQETLKTWIYPMNLGKIREYQYNIVRQGLFSNMLVALPTGLGKTFIAATIMLNYFRWTKDAQIVFMAPTKPLVSQQVDACFNIVGIPRSTTTLLTGEINPAIRADEWATKRVFFMTPQTLDNDLRTGICDPKRIILLVVDEAHRAKGEYSYVKVVTFLRRFNTSFRILALTATPGSSVESVQEVIDGLEIAKVEIRTEESIDIQQYTHQRKIEQVIIEPSDEIIMIKDLYSKALQPLVNQLRAHNAYYNNDPMSLTAYGMMKAQQSWMASGAARGASQGLKGMMRALFAVLASVGHGIKLLNFHGVVPFYDSVNDLKNSAEEKGERGGKYRKQIVEHPDFKKMMDRILLWINKDDFVGHPKFTYLSDTILNHFLDAGEGRLPEGAPPSNTRVIVFSEYRDSAEDIVRVLNRHGPMIRASVFVGQADSKRSQGMNQASQLETIRRFKAGIFNVIVATSIGEEGLDIGQVDLIVCYDASSSPIRMLQRMGRTGRKRAGNIVLLLMKGKEEENFIKANDNYQQMQKMIASGKKFAFRHDLSRRIVPKEISPVVDKRIVEIPTENTQDPSLPEPKRRPMKKTKRPPKKFHMPDGVQTGFRKASRLDGADSAQEEDSEEDEARKPAEEESSPIPSLESVLLNPTQLKDLERTYQNVHGEGVQEIGMPELDKHPIVQRSLRPVKLVKHGAATKRFVRTIAAMNGVTDETVDRWREIYENGEGAKVGLPSQLEEAGSTSEEEEEEDQDEDDESEEDDATQVQRRRRVSASSSKRQRSSRLPRAKDHMFSKQQRRSITIRSDSDSESESDLEIGLDNSDPEEPTPRPHRRQASSASASRKKSAPKQKPKQKAPPPRRHRRGMSIDLLKSSSPGRGYDEDEEEDNGSDLVDFIDDGTPRRRSGRRGDEDGERGGVSASSSSSAASDSEVWVGEEVEELEDDEEDIYELAREHERIAWADEDGEGQNTKQQQQQKKKKFFEPTIFTPTQDSIVEDEELPSLETLVGRTPGGKRRVEEVQVVDADEGAGDLGMDVVEDDDKDEDEDEIGDGRSKRMRRREQKTRMVVFDSDEDEDEDD